MRSRLAAVLAVIALVVAACSDDDSASTTAPTTTVASTTTSPSSTGPAIPVDPDLVPDGEPDLLAAMVLFPGELPAPYDDLPFDPIESGYSPAGGSLASALDPTDEADDIIRFGQVAEFAAAYGDPHVVGVAFNAAQFATPEGGAAYLEDWVEDLRSSAEEPSDDRFVLEDFHSETLEGLGDQAIRIGYTSRFLLSDGSTSTRLGGSVVVRKGTLVLWVWGNGDQAEQILDDFTQLTAERVTAVADGTLPPRDYASLGLTDPPTLALDSFTFTYEHGVEAPEGGFSVEIVGEFEGPDRSSCRTTITVDGFEAVETYLVVDGTRVWVGDQTGYQELLLRDPAALSSLTSCPAHPNHWDHTKLHRLEVTNGEEVQVSGVAALRSDFTDDIEDMRAAGFVDAEIGEFTRYELSVAADGGWPIQLDVERAITVAAAMRMYGLSTDGLANPEAPAIVYERLLLSRINDPDIKVELPLLAG